MVKKNKSLHFLPALVLLLLVALTPASAAWITSYDSPETKIFSMAVYDNKLYAGTYINGIIYVYDGTYWQTAYDSPEAVIRSLAAYNGKLYAGTEDNGIIYAYNGTSWAVSYDTPEPSVSSFGVYNGKLYAGTYPNGRIYVYNGTSWALGYDTPESAVWAFAAYRNRLYASAQSRGVIYVYDGASWSKSYQSTDPMVISLAVYNNTPGSDKLYAGTCSNGLIHFYDGASWATSNPNIGTCVGPMALYNNKLYAVGVGGGSYSYNGTSWSASSGSPGGVLSLAAYNNKLYAGTGDSGIIYELYEASIPTPTATPTSTPTANISCTDTDGGQNFLVKGTCSGQSGELVGQTGSWNDTCISPTMVSDMFCYNSISCGQIITACPADHPLCQDGRCIASGNQTPTPTATPNITANQTQTPTPTITTNQTQTPTAVPTPTPTSTQAVNLTYMDCTSPNTCMIPDEGSRASCTMVPDKACQLWYTVCYSCPEKREEYGNCTAYQYGFYSHRFNATLVNEICKSDLDNNFDWKSRGWPEHPSGKRGDETINQWMARVEGSGDQPSSPIECPKSATWAVNPEGKNCRQFPSPCDVPRNWIVVDSCLAANKTQTGQCDNGCPYGDSCIPFGTRFTANGVAQYCDFATKSVAGQKNDGASCQNSYECVSNYCGNGVCSNIQKELQQTRGLLQQILDFLRELFKAFTIKTK